MKLTDEQFLKLFHIAKGLYEGIGMNHLTRMSTNEVCVKLGYSQYVFGYTNCPNNDVRLGENYSFYMKEYIVKNVLSISNEGMEEKESLFNDEKQILVMNQSLIFRTISEWQ